MNRLERLDLWIYTKRVRFYKWRVDRYTNKVLKKVQEQREKEAGD